MPEESGECNVHPDLTKALKSFQLIQRKPLKIANVPDTHFPRAGNGVGLPSG